MFVFDELSAAAADLLVLRRDLHVEVLVLRPEAEEVIGLILVRRQPTRLLREPAALLRLPLSLSILAPSHPRSVRPLRGHIHWTPRLYLAATGAPALTRPGVGGRFPGVILGTGGEVRGVMKMRKLSILLAAGLAISLVACGDDDDTDATATPGAGETATATGTMAPGETTTPGATTTPGSPTSGPGASPSAVATLPGGSTDPVDVPPVPTVVAEVAYLQDVRIGLHPDTSSERIVFEFEGALPQTRVEYVDSVQQCGSGQDVDIDGDAILSVRFLDAAAHDSQGEVTFDEQQIDGSGDLIQEAEQFCDFENQVEWAIGLDEERDFIVTHLADPPRLVIDIKE